MKETLIFCFDGTCNDPEDAGNREEDDSITNILKLHILFGGDLSNEAKIQIDDDSQQRSFYYSGVGTYGTWFRKFINKTLAPEHFFSDVKSILNDAIKDLKKHYPEGSHEDIHVLVFGFSRGAALARRFAVVAKEKAGIEGLKIDFLGVFDTVASISSLFLGKIGTDLSVETKPASDVVFENDTMSQDVRKAVHLVALDENRIAFQPTLFHHDPDRITEVWFPGVHSDVGGGYWYDGLSDLALEYMVKKVKRECVGYVRILNPGEVDYGQLNDKGDTQISKDIMNRKPLVNGAIHKHNRKITGKMTLYPREIRISGKPSGLHPMVHASVRLRYKEVPDYRPRTLEDAQYVVTGTCERLSEAKYVVTTDDNQVGEIREGVSELGRE